jgi:hypothetical protein
VSQSLPACARNDAGHHDGGGSGDTHDAVVGRHECSRRRVSQRCGEWGKSSRTVEDTRTTALMIAAMRIEEMMMMMMMVSIGEMVMIRIKVIGEMFMVMIRIRVIGEMVMMEEMLMIWISVMVMIRIKVI